MWHARAVVVAGMVLLSGVAVADPRLNGVRWRGTIEFVADEPLREETRPGSCSIGKRCTEVNTSRSSHRLESKLVLDGKSEDALATSSFATHLSTKRTTTFDEECPTTGSMLRPKKGPVKGGTIEDASAMDAVGSVTGRMRASVVVENGKYRVSFRVAPVAGKATFVDTYKATGGCADRNQPAKPPATREWHSMNWEIDHWEPLPALPRDLRTLALSGSGSKGPAKYRYSLSPVLEPKSGLVANAGKDQQVTFGKPVTLDGSRSKPREELTYTWRVAAATCVADDSVKSLREISGEKPTFAPPCTLDMELRVRDAEGNEATDTMRITVERRAWKTPFPATKSNWKHMPDASKDARWGMPFRVDGKDDAKANPSKPADLKWGENVCAHDQHPTTHGITHPHPIGVAAMESAGTPEWRGGGLELATWSGGPFDGWWYVKSSSIEITREAIFNEWARPDGPTPPGAPMNFARANARNYARWKAALQWHETEGSPARPKTGHSRLIRDAIAKDPRLDPRKAVEPLIARDKYGLWSRADQVLYALNKQLVTASAALDENITPAKVNWSGTIQYWNPTTGAYEPLQDSM